MSANTTGEKFTPEMRAELARGFEESRAAYERERDARLEAPTPATNGADPRVDASREAFLLTGDVAELVHSIRACAETIDDRDVSAAVRTLRSATTRLGNLLAAKQRGAA